MPRARLIDPPILPLTAARDLPLSAMACSSGTQPEAAHRSIACTTNENGRRWRVPPIDSADTRTCTTHAGNHSQPALPVDTRVRTRPTATVFTEVAAALLTRHSLGADTLLSYFCGFWLAWRVQMVEASAANLARHTRPHVQSITHTSGETNRTPLCFEFSNRCCQFPLQQFHLSLHPCRLRAQLGHPATMCVG